MVLAVAAFKEACAHIPFHFCYDTSHAWLGQSDLPTDAM
jgi:hypothetical protein